jgi:hypothetical protein
VAAHPVGPGRCGSPLFSVPCMHAFLLMYADWASMQACAEMLHATSCTVYCHCIQPRCALRPSLVMHPACIGDHPPTDDAGYLEFARQLPRPDIYEAITQTEPLTPISCYARTGNVRRRYHEVRGAPPCAARPPCSLQRS